MKHKDYIPLNHDAENPAKILHIVVSDSFWIVADSLGKLFKIKFNGSNYKDYDIETILSTNSGKMNDMILSPILSASVTAGDDGFIRLWDYTN